MAPATTSVTTVGVFEIRASRSHGLIADGGTAAKRRRQPRTSSTHAYSRAIESTAEAFRSAGRTSQVYVSISSCDVIEPSRASSIVRRRSSCVDPRSP